MPPRSSRRPSERAVVQGRHPAAGGLAPAASFGRRAVAPRYRSTSSSSARGAGGHAAAAGGRAECWVLSRRSVTARYRGCRGCSSCPRIDVCRSRLPASRSAGGSSEKLMNAAEGGARQARGGFAIRGVPKSSGLYVSRWSPEAGGEVGHGRSGRVAGSAGSPRDARRLRGPRPTWAVAGGSGLTRGALAVPLSSSLRFGR